MKTLLFDVDNTLLNFDASENYALEKVMEKYGIPITKENKTVYSRVNKQW